MARKREQRLRRRARAALRQAVRDLEREIAELRGLAPIARLAIRYVDEIDAPNHREPFSIANRRHELRMSVYGWREQRAAARRAA